MKDVNQEEEWEEKEQEKEQREEMFKEAVRECLHVYPNVAKCCGTGVEAQVCGIIYGDPWKETLRMILAF